MPTDINTIVAWASIISALGTLLAFFFLASSFEIQAKANLEQSKIAKLEVERRIMEKRPLFFAEKIDDDYGKGDYAYQYGLYEIKLLRNDIFKFNFDYTLSQDLQELEPEILSNIYAIPEGMIESTIVHFYYKIEKSKISHYEATVKKENRNLSYVITLSYDDAIGNSYTQTIYIAHTYLPYNYPPKSPSLDEAFNRLKS